MIFLMALNIISTFVTAQEPETLRYYIGQVMHHNGTEYIITAYENNLFPFIDKEYVEITITAERPIMVFGFEFAKDTLRKTVKEGKKPGADPMIVSENSAIVMRSYALKSYIIGILFIFGLSKSLITDMYKQSAETHPQACIVNHM